MLVQSAFIHNSGVKWKAAEVRSLYERGAVNRDDVLQVLVSVGPTICHT